MRIVHVTAHLGGGVGKAHAAIRAVDPQAADHTYVLLEAPRDRRYADALRATGAHVIEAPPHDDVLALAAAADIVQIEFWNHPRIYEALARFSWPAGRYLFWCHVSGLAPPLVAPGLTEAADLFVYTSTCSLRTAAKGKLGVVGSGFGLDQPPKRRAPERLLRGGYLGTVDFVKMSPDFFAIVDSVEAPHFEILVYGAYDPDGAVVEAHRLMKRPERVRLMGQTADPALALAGLDFFFYPLDRNHFGTAENALVEAMSAGLAPLVLDNPAELAIVSHERTGLVAGNASEAAAALQRLLGDRGVREALGDAAAQDAAERFRPDISRRAFAALYEEFAVIDKRVPEFSAALGAGPLDWFRGSFPEGAAAAEGRPSKGSLAHFLQCFPEDADLHRDAGATDQPDRRQE